MNETVSQDSVTKDIGTIENIALQPEELFCRICYSLENPLGSYTDLISPCGCKGTVKYVHRYCLRIWRFKGKMVKDIKICEQCYCEYKVDDERRSSSIIVAISTVTLMLSLLLATNIFLISTADTLSFIANDISILLNGQKKGCSFSNSPHILPPISKSIHRKEPRTGYTYRKFNDPQGYRQTVCIRDNSSPVKGSYLSGVLEQTTFSSVSAMGLVYAFFFENTYILFVNIVLVFWRALAFGSVTDWILYGTLYTYTYMRMFRNMYTRLDTYCMYVINIY